MRQIPLTRGMVALVDDDDCARLVTYTWWAESRPSGNWYAAVKAPTSGKLYMHRVVLSAQLGEVIDHIDGNGLNNQKHNLRRVTRRQNNHNRKRKIGGSSNYKGVAWDKYHAAWRVRARCGPIGQDGKACEHFVGYFHCERIAALAYDDQARRAFGVFAGLNFDVVPETAIAEAAKRIVVEIGRKPQ